MEDQNLENNKTSKCSINSGIIVSSIISLILLGLIGYSWYSSNQKFKTIDKKLSALDAKQLTLSESLNKEKETTPTVVYDDRLYKNTRFIPTRNLQDLDETMKTNLFKDTEKNIEFEYPADWSEPKYVETSQLDNNISTEPIWKLSIVSEHHPIDLTTTTQERLVPSNYYYFLAAYPLENYNTLLDKLNNGGNYTLEKFDTNGHKGLYTTSGGTCVGNDAYVFGEKYLMFLEACDQRNIENSDLNEKQTRQTMNLILSTLKF